MEGGMEGERSANKLSVNKPSLRMVINLLLALIRSQVSSNLLPVKSFVKHIFTHTPCEFKSFS